MLYMLLFMFLVFSPSFVSQHGKNTTTKYILFDIIYLTNMYISIQDPLIWLVYLSFTGVGLMVDWLLDLFSVASTGLLIDGWLIDDWPVTKSHGFSHYWLCCPYGLLMQVSYAWNPYIGESIMVEAGASLGTLVNSLQ